MKPILKWAGGKSKVSHHIKQLYSSCNNVTRYVEPFVGGMAVALDVECSNTLINDINPYLINFYKWLQKGLIVEEEFENTDIWYYNVRNRFNDLVRKNISDTKEAAELFYYLNKQCFNGLWRVNKNGEFNVPFGRYKKLNIKQDLTEYVPIIKDWLFVNTDFSNLEILPNDFVYCDPPYYDDNCFTQYSKENFTWDDHVRLAEWANSLNVNVCVSNQYTERIMSLYSKLGWQIQFINAPRTISCDGNRTPKLEILAYKKL